MRGLVLAHVLASGVLPAQAPEGARALTPSAIRDSLRTLQEIDAYLRGSPRDAEAWHRRGMIAWALAIRDQVPPPVAGIEWQRFGRAADTSLRIAAHLAPDSVQYSVAAARYLSTFFGPFNRTASSIAHAKAHDEALARGDARQIVLSGRSAGRLEWRFFQGMSRGITDEAGSVSPLVRTQNARPLRGRQAAAAAAPPELRAEDHALRAEQYFRDAVRADPSDEAAARDLAFLLSDSNRWSEVAALARDLTDRHPASAWGWLLAGLAAQRRTDYVVAATALERGIALLDDATRQRWDRLDRILSVEDSATFATLGLRERTEQASAYWRDQDALWSIVGDEPRTEFLARLVQAELRFSIPDLGVSGLDTDGAKVVVRWGPPPQRITFGPRSHWVWGREWDARFLGFDEWRFDPIYADSVELLMQQMPARWDNVDVAHVDSLPSQVARFRGVEGIDALVAYSTNASAILASSDVRQTVHLHRWTLRDHEVLARDSTVIRADSIVAQIIPLSSAQHTFRVEVSAPDAPRAGRVSRNIDARHDAPTGMPRSGFGVSDILIAVGGPSNGVTARRWSEFDVVPLVGTASRAEGVSVIWETYEPQDSARSASLDVTVQLMPLDAQVSIRAAVIARLRDLVGAPAERADGSSEVRFQQTRAWAPILVDELRLDLSTVPEGRYALRLIVADRHGRRQADRVVVFTVGP